VAFTTKDGENQYGEEDYQKCEGCERRHEAREAARDHQRR
jgi:hypothetical protein